MVIKYTSTKSEIIYDDDDSDIIDALPESVRKDILRGLITLSDLDIPEFFTEEELRNIKNSSRRV